MNDLEAVWTAAKDGFGAGDYVALVKAGVPKQWLAAHLYDDFWPGALDIAIENGKWRQMFRGQRAIILPIVGGGGAIIDLVAFRPETPRSAWLLTGAGRFLGEGSIFDAEFLNKALIIRASVLDWLKAGMDGLVILDWKQLWPFWFTKVPALQFEDRVFAQIARAQMERPFRIPPVLVPAS